MNLITVQIDVNRAKTFFPTILAVMRARSSDPTARSKTYHKERLRQHLVEVGRAYVEAHGHQPVSVRTLAQ